MDSTPSTPEHDTPKGQPLNHYDTQVMSMAARVAKDLEDQATKAASYGEDPDAELHGDSARQVGALAFLQHALAHVREQFARELAGRVQEEGMTADAIAEGLAEHGITTTGDQIRAAYPQVMTMERQLVWLITHGPRYLPMLHQVSRFVATWPTLVRSEHYKEASETHRLIAATLSDVGWDGTVAGLGILERWVFIHYRPTANAWLSHMAVEVLPPGEVRDAAMALQQAVAEFYETGRGDVAPSGDLTFTATAGDPLTEMRESVHKLDASIPLHAVGRVLS